MKKQIILNSRQDIVPTLQSDYYKMGVYNFLKVYRGGQRDGYTAPCVLEIERYETEDTK